MCLYDYFLQIVASPTNAMAVQDGPTSIRVSWTPSVNATGYVIYNSSGVSSGNVTVSNGSANTHTLSGLQNGGIYDISIAATADQFSSGSVAVNMPVGLGKDNMHCLFLHS